MNVGQLKEWLLRYEPSDDLPILVAADPEGNGFRPLQDVEFALIETNEDKHGYVEGVSYEDELEEDEDASDYEGRLVLWP